MGLGDGLVGIRTIERTGREIAKNPEAALPDLAAACRACVGRDRAEAVIVGGAAMAGLATRVQPHVGVPISASSRPACRPLSLRPKHHIGDRRPSPSTIPVSASL
jgi:Asp/Glu/hydantoin racemase